MISRHPLAYLIRWCFIAVLFCAWRISLANAAINISCVGDSITSGVGVQIAAMDSYPAKLQGVMGTNYHVGNFGVSGTTLLTNGDMPYIQQQLYASSQNRPTPSIVVIMLGSNDSKPQNWIYGTNFYTNYASLIAVYAGRIVPTPRVFICTPPPVFGNNSPNINPGIVATNISPIIRQLGSDLNIQVIDMQTLLAGHGEWFPDNVHPNTNGTAVMAAIVYTAIMGDTLNGAIPSLAIQQLDASHNVLNWPSGGAGWVVQTRPIVEASVNWTIVPATAFNKGSVMLQTNPITTNSFFRLWQPTH